MFRLITTFVLLLLILPPLAVSAPIVTPSDLRPGDQYRLVFVSSTHRGTTAFIETFNQFITDRANSVPELAALGTTWKAIMSTNPASGVPAIAAWDNTGTNPSISTGVPLYSTSGKLIATSNADLWDGSIANPIQASESGGFGGPYVWTGTYPVFGAAQDHPMGTQDIYIGDRDAYSDTSWAAAQTAQPYLPDDTRETWAIYGMSGVLTVVPEPATLPPALGAVSALLAWRAVQGRKRLSKSRGSCRYSP